MGRRRFFGRLIIAHYRFFKFKVPGAAHAGAILSYLGWGIVIEEEHPVGSEVEIAGVFHGWTFVLHKGMVDKSEILNKKGEQKD